MTIRNIRKNLAGMEDILQGVGQEQQIRGPSNYNIAKIDVPYSVLTEADLVALDVAKYTRARVYSSATDFIDYLYDSAVTTGITPTVGSGSWIAVNIVVATSADLALLASGVNTLSKYEGKQVWDSTVSRPVWSAGPLDTNVWVYADGVTAQTPV